MKVKVNLTIEENLVERTKHYAKMQGVSISQIVENFLREKVSTHETSFCNRWRGYFQLSTKNDKRSQKLKERYIT